MTTVTMKHFDILTFVNTAKANGIAEEFAEYTGRELEQLAETVEEQRMEIAALKSNELATKSDVRESELRLQKEIEIIRREIEVLRNDHFRLIVYAGIGVSIYLTGAMYTMIKLLVH